MNTRPLRRWRIYVYRDGGFWNPPQYTVASKSADVRNRLAREIGPEAAQKSCVTAYADLNGQHHPDFSWAS